MIFSIACDKVLSGEKRQTRRLRRGPYQVGRTYAVQAKRGGKSLGRIRMERIWQHDILSITFESARLEGFKDKREFLVAFQRVNSLPEFWYGPVWAFEFSLVE